jgi:hypothetical protein
MNEGQRKRKVGSGMKPRGNKRFKQQKETKSMTEQSTVEGQAQSIIEPVLEAQDRNETPGNLEPKNGENSVQNLEKSEVTVAHDEELEKAMKESSEPQFTPQPIPGREFADLGGPTEEELVRAVFENGKSETLVDLETAMAVGTGTVKDLGLDYNSLTKITKERLEPISGSAPKEKAALDSSYAIGVDFGMKESKSVMAVIKHGGSGLPDELLATLGVVSIGPQADGSEKFVITIAEGYTDAVRQWAEADGVDVSRWLSDRLYEYISTYGEPAQGR